MCIKLSGSNAILDTASAVVVASAIPPSTEADDRVVVAVVYIGNVSINTLNTNGVAMVTPFPASINDIDAMTRCRMAMAWYRCLSSPTVASIAAVGNGGQT